jgi:ATP-dependent RNA helicase SUPV3L1/SUV3
LASPAADEAPASSEETPQAAAADEEIEIWRPAPRRPRAPPRPHGGNREAASHGGKHREQRRHGRPENRAPAEAADASAAPASPSPAPQPLRHGRPDRRDEEARRRDKGGEDSRPPREERRPNRDFGPRRESRPVQVDPDSPFAKLAALKPLLERRDKRT